MDKADLFIPVVLGTAREERESANCAQYIFEQVQKYGVASELVDVRSMLIPATVPSWVEDKSADMWREIAKRADGFVMVVPEYNRTPPGEFKLLIDRAKDEYLHKPVVVCGVSSGGFGGARVVEALLPVWVTLQMVPVKSSVFFSEVADLFDEAGKMQDEEFDERVVGMMDELTWYAEALRQAKQNENNS